MDRVQGKVKDDVDEEVLRLIVGRDISEYE